MGEAAGDAADRFSAAFPPHPAHAAAARLFTGAIGRHYELDESSLEDVKIAVSEGFALALRGAERVEGADSLLVRAAADERRVVFEIPQPDSLPAPVLDQEATPTPDLVASGLSMEIIRSLFDDADIADEDGRPVIRFSVPRDPQALEE